MKSPKADLDAELRLDQYPIEVLEMVLTILESQAEHKVPSRSHSNAN